MKLNTTLFVPVLLAAAAAAQASTPAQDDAYTAAPGDTNMPSGPAPLPTHLAAPPPSTALAPSVLTPVVVFDRTASTPTPAPAAAMPAAPTVATNITIAAAAADTSVNIKDFAFAPTATTITAGSTVHWKNLDGEPHTVRAVDATFASNALDQNDSYSVKFDKPGTYKYVCSIHPQMVGTIVVKAAN